MKHVDVRYAAYAGAVPPRQIRMKAGGWGGSSEGMVDGSQPQPWHCLPFVEASVYGLELVYQFDTECHVVNDGGAVRFDFDYTKEPGGVLTGGEFITFNPKDKPKFCLFNTRLDLVAPPGHVIRTEPHPRFFTDDTGTVPLSMIGHIQSEWYSRKLFVVFKVPPPGTRHIFRKGEPYAQVVFVPQRVSHRVTQLTTEEEAQRRDLEEAIDGTRSHIADNIWHNPDGSEFNNHYKVLARAFADGSLAGVQSVVDAATKKKRRGLPHDKPIAEYVAIADDLISKQEFEPARAIYAHVLENDPHNAAASAAWACASAAPARRSAGST